MGRIPSSHSSSVKTAGLSMLEVLIAMSILAIASAGLSSMFSSSFRATRQLAQNNELTTLQFNLINVLRNSPSCKNTLSGLPLTDVATDIDARDNSGAKVIRNGYVYNGMQVQSLTARSGAPSAGVYLITIRLVAKRQPSFGSQDSYTSDFFVNAIFDASNNIIDCFYKPQGAWSLINQGQFTLPTVSSDPSSATWQRMGLFTVGGTIVGMAPNLHYNAAIEKFNFRSLAAMTTKCQRPGTCEGHTDCLAKLADSGYVDCPFADSDMSVPIEAGGNMWQVSVQATPSTNSLGEIWVTMVDANTSTEVETIKVGSCSQNRQCSLTSPTKTIPTIIGHKYKFYYRLRMVRDSDLTPLPGHTDDYPYLGCWNPIVSYQEYIKY